MAALCRTSHVTIRGWPKDALSLLILYLEESSASTLVDIPPRQSSIGPVSPAACNFSPPQWVSQPMAITLARASVFFKDDKRLSTAIARARPGLRTVALP